MNLCHQVSLHHTGIQGLDDTHLALSVCVRACLSEYLLLEYHTACASYSDSIAAHSLYHWLVNSTSNVRCLTTVGGTCNRDLQIYQAAVSMCASSQLGSKCAKRAPTLSHMNEKKSSIQTYVQTLAIITSIQDASLVKICLYITG